MKTIGLLGGMSWQSTIDYYRILNEEVARRLGGLHSAKIVMYSVDFSEIAEMQRRGEWDAAGAVLAEAARNLERADADMVLIGANTMHLVADAVQQAVRIPLVHIADATAARVRQAGLTRVGLLGTRYTMEKDFLKDRLASHGLFMCPTRKIGRKSTGSIMRNCASGSSRRNPASASRRRRSGWSVRERRASCSAARSCRC